MSTQDENHGEPKVAPRLGTGLRAIIPEYMVVALNEPLPDEAREAVIAALERVTPIIARLSDDAHGTYIIEHPVVTTLNLHARALSDLGRGITETYLRADKVGGTASAKASGRQRARDAVTFCRCLIANGMPRPKAIKTVTVEFGLEEGQLGNWLIPDRNPGRRK